MLKIKNNARKDGEKKDKKRIDIFQTFTKLWVSVLLIIAVFDLQLSYILAYLGRDIIAETLSVAIVTEIIGVVGVYMVRAFFDTYFEKKHEREVEEKDKEIEEGDTPSDDAEG